MTRISLQTSGFDVDRDVSGNIGLGVLRRFNLTFNYAGRRLVLEPNGRHDTPDVFNRTGLRLKRGADGWTITELFPGSPAADAHLQAGQLVRAIDRLPPTRLDDEGVAAKLIGPVGSVLALQVDEVGAGSTVRLWLRDIL